MNGLSLAALLGAANWWIGSRFSDVDQDEAVSAGRPLGEAAAADQDDERHPDDRPNYLWLPGPLFQ